MCIRDSVDTIAVEIFRVTPVFAMRAIITGKNDQGILCQSFCLLYTSDAADERSSVDLGGRRIIKKKTTVHKTGHGTITQKKERIY